MSIFIPQLAAARTASGRRGGALARSAAMARTWCSRVSRAPGGDLFRTARYLACRVRLVRGCTARRYCDGRAVAADAMLRGLWRSDAARVAFQPHHTDTPSPAGVSSCSSASRLPMTLNIPFRHLRPRRRCGLYADGTGDIPLPITGDDRVAYLMLWPHVRPWRAARTEPMLRSSKTPSRFPKF